MINSPLDASEKAADANFTTKSVGDPVEPCRAKSTDPLTKWRADKEETIDRALAQQRELLQAKQKELKMWDADAKQKFKKAFGADDEASREKIATRVDKMLKVNKSMTVGNFKPADPSQPNRFAYVYPTDSSHTLYLDQGFDKAPDQGQDSKAGTLCHEMSHFSNIGGTKDKFKDVNNDEPVYGVTGSRKLATDSPC